MNSTDIHDILNEEKAWLASHPSMQPWDAGCRRVVALLEDCLRRYSEMVRERAAGEGDADRAIYIARLWQCLGYHWRDALAISSSDDHVAASHVAERIAAGRGYRGGGQLGGDPLRDVVLAVAMVRKDQRAPHVFQEDYQAFACGLAAKIHKRLGADPDSWWNDLLDHLAGYSGRAARLDRFSGRCALRNWPSGTWNGEDRTEYLGNADESVVLIGGNLRRLVMQTRPTIRVVRVCLVLCLALAWQRSPAVAADGQRWAVVVGVNQYVELQDLNFCVADARKFRDQLVSAGFPADNVFLLVDGSDAASQPNRANIQRQIASVLQVAEKDDLVLVSFSGHGVHLDGKSYFCPSEANLDNAQTTMVPLELIYKQLEASQSRQKLLLVDACRNDPRPPGSRDATSHQRSLKGLSDELKAVPAGILALSSAAEGQLSWEDEQFGHGVFMHFVMEGLSGRADLEVNGNRNGAVSLLELYAYSNLQTKRWVLRNRPGYLQTPELLGKITGDFDLGRKVAPPLDVAPFSGTTARGHQQAWAKHVGQPVESSNRIGMKLTLIPPGEVVMGSTVSAEEIDRRFPGGKVEYYAAEHPHHTVRLTRPFYLGTHEVTVGDFRRFVTATGHKTTATDAWMGRMRRVRQTVGAGGTSSTSRTVTPRLRRRAGSSRTGSGCTICWGT